MMNKLLRSHQEKEKSGFLSLNPASKLESFLLSLFFLLLPTQLGKHFWPDFSIVSGIRIDYLSPIIYLTDILLVLLFISFLLRQRASFKISKLQRTSKKYLLISALISLFLLLTIVFSDSPLLSIYGIVKLYEFSFLAAYLKKTIQTHFQLQQVASLFAISALGESLLAIAQYLNQGSINGIFYFFGERAFTGATPGIANADISGALILRPYATFSHPNVLAGYLLVAMVLIWNFVLPQKSRWIQVFGILVLVISSVALQLTFGRVAILLWILLVVFLLIKIMFRTAKTFRIKMLALLIVVSGIIVVSIIPLTHDVIIRFSQTSLTDESVTERTALLSASIKMIQRHPFFGVGLYNFIPALAPLQRPMPLGLYLQPVHNIFVLVFAETGIIGFAFFMWLLIATVQRYKNQNVGGRSVFFILLLIVIVTGLFDHYWLTLQQGQLLFATIIGFSWATLKKS